MADGRIRSPKPVNVRNGVVRCAWLVNPGQIPQQNVRLTIENGVVCEIAAVPPDERHRIDSVAVLPRLVNAHTHLEFSSLTAPLKPSRPFINWVRSVIQHRINSEIPSGQNVDAGVRESIEAGVSLVGEICTSDDGLEALLKTCPTLDIQAVSFRELLGFTADRIPEQQLVVERHCEAANTGDVQPGLSPHAPYSVHPELVEYVVARAARDSLPVAMHLAETLDELELLASQTGPFVELLETLKLWDRSVLKKGSTPLRYLQQLAAVPRALAIHGNYFGKAEIEFLAEHTNIAVVYCPRTHDWFGHQNHPWNKLRSAGATVLLGTDSRASNPDLSVWEELQFVAATVTEPIWDLLPMVTTTAAESLGHAPAKFRISPDLPFHGMAVPVEAESLKQLNVQLIRASARG